MTMSDVKKITEEELKALNEVVTPMKKITEALGSMEINKAKALKDYEGFEAQLQELQKGLEEAYGSVSINLQTGEITEEEAPEMKVAE